MMMTEAAKQARREYQRRWREKNRERIRQYDREWTKNNPDKVKAAQARFYERQAAKLLEEEQ